MNTTHASHRPDRSHRRLRRPGRLLLAVAGAVAVLLASACDTSEQVPWASYNSQLQQRIDSAAVTGRCSVLQALLAVARNTSDAHEKATGFRNDALVSYIKAAQARAGCPTANG